MRFDFQRFPVIFGTIRNLQPGRRRVKQFFLKDCCCSPLPLAVWNSKFDYPYQCVHTHDCVEMQFILSGAGWCSINGKHYPMLAGDLYIIPPGDTHEFECDPGLKFMNIMFNETFFTPEEMAIFRTFPVFTNALPTHKFTFHPPVREKMSALLDSLEEELKFQDGNFRFNAKALLIQFLVLAERHIHESAGIVSVGDPRKISRIFHYIEKHSTEKITLEKLASLTGNSPAYLGRQFKRLTGISITDYIGRHRIEKARCELENTDDTVAEIADRLGFYDSSYFIKSFQAFVGMTPAQYRKIGRKQHFYQNTTIF